MESIETGVRQRPHIEKAVAEILEKKIENIFLVGCGGSLAVMSPLRYIIDIESQIPAYEYNSSEFLAVKPCKFSSGSLMITSSYTGTTKETVAAAEWAREKGASIIAFVGKLDSPLGRLADYAFENDAKAGVTDSKLIMLYQILFNIIKKTDSYQDYDEWMKTMELLPQLLDQVKEAARERAESFAQAYKDETFFFVTGSGAGWGEAYSYANCILEEMQWIYAQPVHSGEFFHGAFEMLTEDSPIIVMQGEDRTRPLGDRVLEFVSQYTKKIIHVDAKDYELPEVPEKFRGYLTPIVLSAVMSIYSERLEAARNHPLSTRRYMFKVEY
ncbi:MAG TPA: SIS domain-containing protein, partial [Anaerovoracaceae bacterium]|nr:SIS domain-containing protein [Anaerovoracaceae bacterium]